jgi:hypothetical protein
LTICDLYKSRWQVELFFKWIKQHLRIKKFYGTSENAVKTHGDSVLGEVNMDTRAVSDSWRPILTGSKYGENMDPRCGSSQSIRMP